jgi:predicted double-glycine peptidase
MTIANEEKLDVPVRLMEQEFKYNCGPTALGIVLKSQFGLDLTQRELNLLTGVTQDGTSEYHFMRALKLLGFKFDEEGRGTLPQLRQYLRHNILPIVHVVLEDGGGHYMVVCGIDDENVRLADPRTGGLIQYGIPFFLGVWKEEAKDNATPWYLAVTGYAPHKIDALISKLKRIKIKTEKARK